MNLDIEALAARFWAKVDKSGGPDACWPWTGAYAGSARPWLPGAPRVPSMKIGGRKGVVVRAQRVALIISGAPIALRGREMYAVARCRNPKCVNPAHLMALAPAELNAFQHSIDMWAKGERITSAKLNPSIVAWMRLAHMNGLCVGTIAGMVGVAWGTAEHAILGVSWAHVPMGREALEAIVPRLEARDESGAA